MKIREVYELLKQEYPTKEAFFYSDETFERDLEQIIFNEYELNTDEATEVLYDVVEKFWSYPEHSTVDDVISSSL